MNSPSFASLAPALVTLVLVAGCGASEAATTPGIDDTGTLDAGNDTGSSGLDSAIDTASGDDAPPSVRRLPCVGRDALATDLPLDVFGALEGELVSLVLPGFKGCSSDTDHLHLQVDVSGKRYDVAITIDSSTGGTPIALTAKDLAATSAPPGWSAATFDFAKDLGVPSADFTPMTKSELLTRLQSELATASFVSIHGHSYTDGTGLHNVHRNGSDHDGVLILRHGGAGGTDHAIALRFSTDVF